ncbi:MAG TPA: tRNA lysidine(34) synthetase TilS, partial [Miltoncostaeaceae bacterium]|nr:tRNA lysidine(34) synthetase TilS [Miltoncostaeaceae bacterium]
LRLHPPAPGDRVLAMVSGGADSTLLMHALAAVHPGALGVVTVDHGLRAEAAGECAAVRAAASALGLPAWTLALDLEPGAGLQARARAARYRAVRALAAREGWDVIAAGHTRTDQAETVLMRMARGTGRTGALGMAPRSGDLVRPLLCVAAGEARDWCRARGLEVADDPGNADRRFARVRARDALEALARVHGGAEEHLAGLADLLRDEEGVLAPAADAAWERCRRGPGVDAARLAGETPALARRVVRRLLAAAGVPAGAATAAAVERVRALAAPGAPPRTVLAGAVPVERQGGVIAVARAGGPPPGPVALPVPGEVRFGAVRLRSRRGPAGPPAPERVALRVDAPLQVRPPRPGDRLAIAGGGRVALGRLLARGGVPSGLRGHVPVVAAGDRVLWVAGHRAAADALAPPGAPSVILELETPP